MGTTKRSARRHPGVLFGVALVSIGLVAGACSSSKDNGKEVTPATEKPAGSTTATTTGETTPATTGDTTE